MTSKVSIISDAYFLLGKSPITTLSPQSNLDIGSSNVYDRVMPASLSVFAFNFATKIQSLNKLTAEPTDTNFKYAFQIPYDLLLLDKVMSSGDSLIYNYRIVGDQIWTNFDDITIYYKYEASSSYFPPVFSLYMVYTMCAHLALPLTQKEELVTMWFKLMEVQEAKTAAVLQNQEPAQEVKSEPLIDAFHSGSYLSN